MTHVELGLLGWDLVLLVTGYAALSAVGAARLRPPDPRLVPLGFFTGWALLGVVLTLVTIAGIDPNVPVVLVVTAVICGICAVVGRRVPRFDLLRPRQERRLMPSVPRLRARRLNLAALGVLAGAVILTALVVVLVISSVHLTTTDELFAALGVLVVAALLTAARAGRAEGRLLPALAAASGACVLLLAAASALIVAVKGAWPAEWDSFLIWGPRGSEIYYFHGLSTGVGGWRVLIHGTYPPLQAVIYAVSFHFAGGVHTSMLPLQNVLLAIGFVGSLLVLADRFAPPWMSFPLLALLAVAPGLFDRVQTVMADPTLAYPVTLGIAVSLLWLATGRRAWLVLGALFLGAATLTKLEGLPDSLLVAFAVGVTAIAHPARRARSALVLLLGPAMVIPWRLWLHAHHFPTSSNDYRSSDVFHPVLLLQRISRYEAALRFLAHSVFDTRTWLVTLPVALVVFALVAVRATAPAAAAACWLVLAYLGAGVVYWVGRPEVNAYLLDNGDRVASTLVIAAGALAPLLLGLGLGRPFVGNQASRVHGERPHEVQRELDVGGGAAVREQEHA